MRRIAITWLLPLVVLVVMPAAARAQSAPLPAVVGEAPPTGLPESLFLAVRDRPVVLQLSDGTEVIARILSTAPGQVLIRILTSHIDAVLDRARITSVRLFQGSRLPGLPPAQQMRVEPRQPEVSARKRRHVAFDHSIVQGFQLDVDAGLFHGFANLGIALALVSEGRVVPASLGLGVGLPVSRDRALKLDLFAHVNIIGDVETSPPAYSSEKLRNRIGVGVGVGLHYTWYNGVNLGFTLPIFGYAFEFRSSSTSGVNNAAGIAYYFLTSAEALPFFYVGYRL